MRQPLTPSSPPWRHWLAARLPVVSLRTALIGMCVIPALAAALLAAAFSTVVVHNVAQRQAEQALERTAAAVVKDAAALATDMLTQTVLLGERITIIEAAALGDPLAASAALQRALRSLHGAGQHVLYAEISAANGRVLATSADGGFGRDDVRLLPPQPGTAQPRIVIAPDPAASDRSLLIASAPIRNQGELLGWFSTASALDAERCERLAGVDQRLVLRQGNAITCATWPVAAQEVERRWPAGGDRSSGSILLAGIEYQVIERRLPWGGEPVDALLLWPSAEVARTGNTTVGLIVLSLLLVLGLVLPLVAVVGAGLAWRMRRLSGALVALADGRRPEPHPSAAAPLVQELRDLNRAIGAFQASLSERDQLTERLRWMANFDSLTGLPNRVLFHDRLGQAFLASRRDGDMLALLSLDLDGFKEVNDRLGHAAGDALLRAVAERLTLCVREADTVARLGGDEFAIILPAIERAEESEMVARRVLLAMQTPFDIDGHPVEIAASIGIAIAADAAATSDDAEALLREADVALYAAKDSGRATWRFFQPEMNARLRERRALEAELRAALAGGELDVHYQPLVALRSGRVLGAEALLRWTGRDGHVHPPLSFIPLAEETGLIVPIGAFVLHRACGFAAARPGLRMAVNVSPVQLRHPGFLADVRAALEGSGLAPSLLELELTETAAFEDTAVTRATLAALRRLGVGISLDDFGTGYSSLGHLRRLSVDRIKIDRSFVRDIAQDPEARAMVRAMVAMAEAVGVGLVGEGVETPEQAEALLAEGCREAQGYMFSRPVPAEQFDALMAEQA